MLKPRRLLLSIIAVVAVPLVGLGIYWAIQPAKRIVTTDHPGVTRENFRLCYNGMSIKEAEGLMDGQVEAQRVHRFGNHLVNTVEWEGEEGTVTLWTSAPWGSNPPPGHICGGAFLGKDKNVEWMG